jgi:phage-related protein
MDSVYFVADGEKSSDYGVLLVKTESGLIGEPFMGNREIISESVPGQPIDYIYDFKERSFSIKITLTLDDGLYWTTEKRREISRWLGKRKFFPFYSTDDINKVYFLTLDGDSELLTNGLQQGFLNLTFRSLSPYTYTDFYEERLDFSTITSSTTFTLTNHGDMDLYPPSMTITKYGDGDISIKNTSDGGRLFKFTGLVDGEVLMINNEERHIETSLSGINRYDAFNGNYLKLLAYSVNHMEITGTCTIALKHRYILKG